MKIPQIIVISRRVLKIPKIRYYFVIYKNEKNINIITIVIEITLLFLINGIILKFQSINLICNNVENEGNDKMNINNVKDTWSFIDERLYDG